MSTSNFTEFNLPRNAYAAFDATSLKQLITNRLKTSGLFTDVDFEGSNINGVVDVMSYMYHLLMFYLNQTASDSLFSQAELFENMNKIVSLVGYKATGNNTATMSVSVSAGAAISSGSYTIKRFSGLTSKGISYCFNSDVTFQKTEDGVVEEIESIGANNLLYQGTFKEYPQYTAIGENFEQFTINIDYPTTVGNRMMDANNIYVFVKDVNTQEWSEWKEVSSLYLAESVSKSFEKRLNEYGHHEIKFGNNVNGRKLQTSDIVAVYYLESDGDSGVLGSNSIGEGKLVQFNSPQFTEIFENIGDRTDYLTAQQLLSISFDNSYASIPPSFIETVDSIRKNAPLLFSAQNRAVTSKDYEVFVNKNFSSVVQSTKVVSNKKFTSEYLAYYYDLGLERPNLDGNVLFNQVSFNDACDFNNVYIFCVPRLGAIQGETTPIQLFSAQKQSIINKLQDVQMTGHNPVINDPIYVGFDIGLPLLGEEYDSDIRDDTILRITRSTEQVISKEQIKSSVYALFVEFFLQENNSLEQFLDFNQLSFDILSLNGVKSIETIRNSGLTDELKVSKLNFVYWNPLYPSANVQSTSQNINMKFFEFPFFYEISKLINKIEVV
jgi:hypothetical protein